MPTVSENKKSIWDYLIWVMTALLYASFTVFNLSAYSTTGVIAIVAVMLVLYLIKNKFTFHIKLGKFHADVLVFAVFCVTSALWAIVSRDAVQKGIQVAEILLCMAVVYMCYQNEQNIRPVVSAVVLGGYIIAAYFIAVYGGLEMAISNATDSIREGVEFANINAIGRNMAITITFNVFLIYHEKKFRWWYVFMVLPIIALAASQSRTSMLCAIVGVGAIVFANTYNKRGFIISLFSVATLGILIYVLLITVPIFNGVLDRMKGLLAMVTGEGAVDSSAIVRQKMIDAGMIAFKEHPLLGCGIGNARLYSAAYANKYTYLHNNYIELLASGGIVGVFLYYRMYFESIVTIVKHKLKSNSYSVLCIILLLLMMIIDYGAVTYYYKETYLFLVIIYLHLRSLKTADKTKAAV